MSSAALGLCGGGYISKRWSAKHRNGVVLVFILTLLVGFFPAVFQYRGFLRELASPISRREATDNEELCSRPPLSELINGTKIIGDVQFLLDFAIIGHSKTGTTSHVNWLRSHPEVQMKRGEDHAMKNGRPTELVTNLYSFPAGARYKRGYKAPNDIRRPSTLASIRTHWPKTKLIVGLRHPVKWMESYYNYRTRRGKKLPPAETMVGDNLPDQVYFHRHLAMLGKTNLPKEEAKLLDVYERYPRMQNQVFLYEVSEPFDTNATRANAYRKQLSRFIGLSKPLDPFFKVRTKSMNEKVAIDICDKKFDNLRAELIEIGKAASEWLLTYFVGLPDVMVSSPQHFRELLLTWSNDPCDQAAEKE